MLDRNTSQTEGDIETAAAQPESAGDAWVAKAASLLSQARDEIAREGDEEHEGDLRRALDDLEQYRDLALSMGQPERVFDALETAWDLQRWTYGRPAIVTRTARQFIQTTGRRLAEWPEIAKEYEQKVLDLELDDVEAKRRSVLFTLLPFVGVAIMVGGLATLLLGRRDDVASSVSLGGAIAIAAGFVFAGIAFVFKRAREARLAAEAENIRRKAKARALPAIAPATGGEYFESLVRINVDNLSDYYTQVRVHTNNSFWASIVAGGLGFVLIAVGLGWGFASSDTSSLSYVATASGVIVEFISGVFFYLYNRTVRQLKGYHDSLLDVQNILLSFRIVEQSDPDHQGPLLEKILTFLLKQRAHGVARPGDHNGGSSS
jgi:uncharacterized membrane protein YedE/YeeE